MAGLIKAAFIMRLKLFWMPYNAILASLLVSDEAAALMDKIYELIRFFRFSHLRRR